MFTLTLNNGRVFLLEENSTLYSINYKGTSSEVAEAMENITSENLNHATIEMGDGTFTFVNKIVTDGSFRPLDEDGKIYATFTTRDKTDNEIIMERLNEQDEALIELAELIVG